jgi:putative oxidoreductase
MRILGQTFGGRGWGWADWPLRIALASIFLSAGIPKWMHLQKTAEMLKLPLPVAVLVATAEVGGSLLILLGGFGDTWAFDWATRISGFAYMIVMTGAILLVHWGQWSSAPTQAHPAGGMEFPFTLWMMGLFFLLCGNSVLGKRKHM